MARQWDHYKHPASKQQSPISRPMDAQWAGSSSTHPVGPEDLQLPQVIALGLPLAHVPHADASILLGAALVRPVTEALVLHQHQITPSADGEMEGAAPSILLRDAAAFQWWGAPVPWFKGDHTYTDFLCTRKGHSYRTDMIPRGISLLS